VLGPRQGVDERLGLEFWECGKLDKIWPRDCAVVFADAVHALNFHPYFIFMDAQVAEVHASSARTSALSVIDAKCAHLSPGVVVFDDGEFL
jgi:hypothetical protein